MLRPNRPLGSFPNPSQASRLGKHKRWTKKLAPIMKKHHMFSATTAVVFKSIASAADECGSPNWSVRFLEEIGYSSCSELLDEQEECLKEYKDAIKQHLKKKIITLQEQVASLKADKDELSGDEEEEEVAAAAVSGAGQAAAAAVAGVDAATREKLRAVFARMRPTETLRAYAEPRGVHNQPCKYAFLGFQPVPGNIKAWYTHTDTGKVVMLFTIHDAADPLNTRLTKANSKKPATPLVAPAGLLTLAQLGGG